jgi:hypothetical protein
VRSNQILRSLIFGSDALAQQFSREPRICRSFYGPDDKKASKAVLGIILSKDSEVQLHKWFRESPDADLRYDIKLQNAWDDRGNQRMSARRRPGLSAWPSLPGMPILGAPATST